MTKTRSLPKPLSFAVSLCLASSAAAQFREAAPTGVPGLFGAAGAPVAGFSALPPSFLQAGSLSQGALFVPLAPIGVPLDLSLAYGAGQGALWRSRSVRGGMPADAWGTAKSVVSSPHVIAGVFKTMEEGDGQTRGLGRMTLGWPKNALAQSLARAYDRLASEIGGLREKGYYKSVYEVASVAKVNKFLRDNEFQIQLENIDSDSVAAAAVLDIPVKWKYEGTALDSFSLANGDVVPGVHMKKGVQILRGARGQFVASLETQGGEKVYVTRYSGDVAADSLTSALDLARETAAGLEPAVDAYSGVRFPMVKFDSKGAVKELIGTRLNTPEGVFFITQFLLQQKLYMNHKGALASAAAAGSATRGAAPRTQPPLVIDGPFLVWFEIDGVPSFAGVISREHMKDPGEFRTEKL